MGDHLVIVLLPLVRHIYPKWDTKMAVNQKYLMPLLFFMDNQHLLQSGVGENVNVTIALMKMFQYLLPMKMIKG